MPRMIEVDEMASIFKIDDIDTIRFISEIDLVRCEECKWWQNPCYGFGAYGYCSDGERRKKDADLS